MDNSGLSEATITRDTNNSIYNKPNKKNQLGLIIAGSIGVAGILITAIATPFVLPALRKHCLPYVPATDLQLINLSKSFQLHSIKGGKFIDVGSGDGRICRLASKQNLYSQVHGVELNYFLVLFSRLLSINTKQVKYFHKDLWNFPLKKYDNICIFGVESMMKPLEDYIIKTNNGNQQTIFACRFPFSKLNKVDEIGYGIDTVWIYRIKANDINNQNNVKS